MVNAFPLSSWPAEALSFLNRARKSSWQNAVMLKELRNCGCFLVCKGVPLLQNSDKMFRLSFSEAKLLLSKWVPEVLRVYYRWSKLLLKMHLSPPKILSCIISKLCFFGFWKPSQRTISMVLLRDISLNSEKQFLMPVRDIMYQITFILRSIW